MPFWSEISRMCRRPKKAFGARDIGVIGSLCLLINNICGPAMVQLPTLYYAAGGLGSTLLFVLVAVWTALAALFLCHTLAQQPGNAHFAHRLELSKLTQKLLPAPVSLCIICALCFALTALNVSQIIVLAQTVVCRA